MADKAAGRSGSYADIGSGTQPAPVDHRRNRQFQSRKSVLIELLTVAGYGGGDGGVFQLLNFPDVRLPHRRSSALNEAHLTLHTTWRTGPLFGLVREFALLAV